MNNKYQEALDAILSFRFCDNYGEPQFAFEKEDEVIRILQELVDKATPKKVLYLTIVDTPDNTYLNGNCPNCHYIVDSTNMVEKYCQYCGQALDWSEDEK